MFFRFEFLSSVELCWLIYPGSGEFKRFPASIPTEVYRGLVHRGVTVNNLVAGVLDRLVSSSC